MDLTQELKRLAVGLDHSGIDCALCGGLTLAVYAKPRATLDIDLMILPDTLEPVKREVARFGFDLPSAPMTFHGGAIPIRRLTKVDERTGEHLVLNLLLVTEETRKI